ncbi:DUF3558 domain-containing protein [Mycolicibacillus parakoreensis]|uniref:DUF3558 domain-containing protein n=1 Tax=Mycolicibacillus parakoreensis TaxID=1069221 RepID=A0ABY3U6R3_9MYCO|nr:DUF3558 domain-containing protein [Mycolicibacillus parakoreensis]MCV7314965.1 DUF3558 domain-containing protein [Mycolicibacillus parakoreensis]ULN53665.1 DUF3558 domain-containing protein [Mycolicibacillus parakoreensis]HLR99163.1 DUF3558 domain-containing protein [Mycolicibacillus parakoreensis]
MSDEITARRRTAAAVLLALLAALGLLAGCARTVGGTAVKPGSPGVNRNDDSRQQFPNLLKECDVLGEDILAKTVGADPLDIQGTFVGAICRWQAGTPSGLIDITRFWFEQGSLDNERDVAQQLDYRIEERRIEGIESIVLRTADPNGACGVASAAEGAVGWWVNPQSPGVDACDQAIKLMQMTLARNY